MLSVDQLQFLKIYYLLLSAIQSHLMWDANLFLIVFCGIWKWWNLFFLYWESVDLSVSHSWTSANSPFHCFFLRPVAWFLSFHLPTDTHVPEGRRSVCTILELCHIIISYFIGCAPANLHYYRPTVSFSSTFASLRQLCDARSRLGSTLQLYPVCGSKLFKEQRSHRRNLVHEPHFSE